MSENIDVRPTFSLMELVSLYTQGTLKVTEGTKSLSDRDSDDLLRIIFETGVVPTPFICVSRGREGWELVEGSRVFNALLIGRILGLGALCAMLLCSLVLIRVCRGSGVQVFKTLGFS